METHVKYLLTKEEVEKVIQEQFDIDPGKTVSVKVFRTGENLAEVTVMPKKEEAPKESTQGE